MRGRSHVWKSNMHRSRHIIIGLISS
jgi:hypothetical protein